MAYKLCEHCMFRYNILYYESWQSSESYQTLNARNLSTLTFSTDSSICLWLLDTRYLSLVTRFLWLFRVTRCGLRGESQTNPKSPIEYLCLLAA